MLYPHSAFAMLRCLTEFIGYGAALLLNHGAKSSDRIASLVYKSANAAFA
jgi:hypothetical protein